MAGYNLTSNGNTPIKTTYNSSTTLVHVSGDLGGAVLTASYQLESGSFVQYEGSGMASGSQYKITHGATNTLFLTVTGATGSTNIDIVAVAE